MHCFFSRYDLMLLLISRTNVSTLQRLYIVTPSLLYNLYCLLWKSHTRTVLFGIGSQKHRNFLHGKDFLEVSSIMGYLLYNPRKYIISFVSPRMPRKLVLAPRTLIWGSDVFVNIQRVEDFVRNCFASEKKTDVIFFYSISTVIDDIKLII